MTVLLLKGIPPPTVFFLCLLLLIRARPYDDGGLLDFVLPPVGCPVPCWQGVRPGMDAVLAVNLLERQHWVDFVQTSTYGWYNVAFTPDQEPAGSRLYNPLMWVEDGSVRRIFLGSNGGLSVGDVLLSLPPPQTMLIFNSTLIYHVPYVMLYPNIGLAVVMDLRTCSLSRSDLWSAADSISLHISDDVTNYAALRSDFVGYTELDKQRWASQIREMDYC